MTLQAFFGIAAGLLEFASCAVYIVSILNRNTKPDRVTWWILAVVTGMLTASYYASGARATMWLPLVYTLCFVITGVLSIKYGDGPVTLSLLDRVSVLGALLAGLVWWFFNSPILALYMNIAVDFIALLPTIYKSYQRPSTESKSAWFFAASASLLNVFAIDQWVFAVALYPLYLFIANTAIAYFIVRGKRA